MTSNKKHILIVDDDDDLRNSLSIILKQQGTQVTTMADGQSALAAAKTTSFDLILIDVVMPDMNGLETLKVLRGIAPQSRMVMMTGFAVADVIKKAIKFGVDGVLYKPFDVSVVVNNLLSKDILVVFEGYLQSAWDRILPILGVMSAKLVFERAFSSSFGEKSLSMNLNITDQGIDLENIRRHIAEMDNKELRTHLQKFLAEIFNLLEDLTGNILTDPIIENISDHLKNK